MLRRQTTQSRRPHTKPRRLKCATSARDRITAAAVLFAHARRCTAAPECGGRTARRKCAHKHTAPSDAVGRQLRVVRLAALRARAHTIRAPQLAPIKGYTRTPVQLLLVCHRRRACQSEPREREMQCCGDRRLCGGAELYYGGAWRQTCAQLRVCAGKGYRGHHSFGCIRWRPPLT